MGRKHSGSTRRKRYDVGCPARPHWVHSGVTASLPGNLSFVRQPRSVYLHADCPRVLLYMSIWLRRQPKTTLKPQSTQLCNLRGVILAASSNQLQSRNFRICGILRSSGMVRMTIAAPPLGWNMSGDGTRWRQSRENCETVLSSAQSDLAGPTERSRSGVSIHVKRAPAFHIGVERPVVSISTGDPSTR